MTLLEKIKGMFKFLDIHGLKYFFEGLRRRGVKYIFEGTQEEWDALTTAQRDHYEIAHIKGDNSVAGTVVDVVKKDDMRAVTSNAVFQERARGVVPDGVSIDDMVGPEWVGTWQTTEATLGHFPYANGTTAPVYAMLHVHTDGSGVTVQELQYYNYIYSKRIYLAGGGWQNYSLTMLTGKCYAGWVVNYDSGAIYRGAKNYGSGLNGCKVQMGFSYGQPYLLVSGNANPKAVGQSFVFAQVPNIQRAFWEWGHFPDEYTSLCSGSFINVSGNGYDVCYSAPFAGTGMDSLWMTGLVGAEVGLLNAKVYANGINR